MRVHYLQVNKTRQIRIFRTRSTCRNGIANIYTYICKLLYKVLETLLFFVAMIIRY